MNITGQQIPLEVSSDHSKSTPFQSFRGDKPRISYGGGFHISKKPAVPPQAYIAETSQPGEISNRLSSNSSVPPLHVIEMELERLKQQSMSIQALRNKQNSETILHLDPPSHRHKHEEQPTFSHKNFGLQELELLKEQNANKIVEIEAELRRSKEPEVRNKHSEFVPVYYKREKSPKRPEKLNGVQKEYYEKFEKFVQGKEKKKVEKVFEGKGTQERVERNLESFKSGKSIGDIKPKPILKTSSSAKSLKIEKNEQPTCLIPYKHMAKLEEVFLKVDEHQDFVVPRGELIESMLEDEHIIKILHLDAVRVTPYQVLDLESMLLYIKSDSCSPEDLLTWNQFLDYFFIAPTFEESHFEGMENPRLNEIDLPSRFMALIQEVFEDIPKKSHDKVSTYEFIKSLKDDTKTSALMSYTARIPESLSHIPEETVQEVLQRMQETAESLISWVEIVGFFSKRGLPKDSNIGQSLITRNSFVKAKMPAKPVKENFVQTEDIELKKHSNRSRSVSPRGKVTFYENSFTKDVTVPAPFKFEEREKDKKKTIREKWLEREEKDREEELKKHINFQYRAREVPREVIQPKFEGLKKALEERSAQVKRESAEKTRQLEKPFNFYLREKEKVKKEPPPPPEYSFKATPIPWACTVTLYESKMKEDDALREERKSRAAQENLRKASLPPRMEMYQNIKKVEIVDNNTPSPKIKVKEPPNFEKLHDRFAKTLEAKKKAKQTTVSEPFLIDQRVEENKKKKEEKRMKKEEEERKRKEKEREEMVKAKTNWKNEHDSIKQRSGRTEIKKSQTKSKSKSKSRSRETSPATSKLKGFTSKDLQKNVTMDALKPPPNPKKPASPINPKKPTAKSSKPSLAPPKPSGFTEKDLNPAKSSGFTEKDLNPSKPSGFTEKDLNPAKPDLSGKNLTPSSSSLAPDKPKPSKNQPSSGSKPSSNPLAPNSNNLAPPNSSSNPLAPSPSSSSGSKFDPLGKKPAVSQASNPLAPSGPSSNLLAPPGQSSNPLAPSYNSSNDFSLPPSNYSDLKPIQEESKHPLSPKTVGVSKPITNKNTKTMENSKAGKDKKYNTLNPLKKVIAADEVLAAGDKSGINEKLRKRKEDAKIQELEYQEKLRAIKENVNKRPLLVESATDSSNKNRSKMKILLSIKKNLEDNGVKYEPYFTEEELTLIQEAEYMSKMNRLK